MFQMPIMPMSSCSTMWQWNTVLPAWSRTGTRSVMLPPFGTMTVSFSAG